MIASIVRYLLKKRAERDERAPSRVRGNVLSSVAVVSEANQPGFEVAKQYARELSTRGIREVDFYCFIRGAKAFKGYEAGTLEIPFGTKSFNVFGKMTAPELLTGMKKEYDLLVDLTPKSTLPTDIVISKVHAKWKAGRREAGREYLFDFMIDSPDSDLKHLCHHINEYLLNFNKLNAA